MENININQSDTIRKLEKKWTGHDYRTNNLVVTKLKGFYKVITNSTNIQKKKKKKKQSQRHTSNNESYDLPPDYFSSLQST